MQIKKQTWIIVAISVAFAAASILLMPGKQEIALMQMKDQYFEEAIKTYETQTAQNKLSLEVAKHLSDLYLKMGDVAKAIEIMETFVAKNPSHIEARKRLGIYYMYVNRQEDYRKNLEAISAVGKDTDTLVQLSQIYNAQGEYDKQATTLRNLIAIEKRKNPVHYIDLANVLASGHKYKEALSVLREFQTLHPEHYTFNEAQLFVAFLLDDQNSKDALIEANAWVYAYRNLDEAAKLAGILHYNGTPDLTLEFLTRFTDDEINSSESLLEQYILAKIAAGEKDAAYRRLKTLADAKKLPPKLTKNFIYTAMSNGDKAMVATLLTGIDLSVYSEAELLALVEQAQARKDLTYISLLKERFPESTYRASYPLLIVAIDVVTHQGDIGRRLDYLDDIALTNDQALQIARMCNSVKQPACTTHFLDKINTTEGLGAQQMVDVGMLYADINEFEKGARYLAFVMQTSKAPEIEKLAAMYAAALGEDEKIQRWIDAHTDMVDKTILTDLLFTANKHERIATAVMIAEILQQRYDSTASRSLLTNSYLKTGQHSAAMALLRANADASEEDQQNYLGILTSLIDSNKEYRSEFQKYVLGKLDASTDENEQISLVYALINAKQSEAALPFIAKLAEDKGGQWATLYATSLDKAGKHDDARRFWLKVASHPAATAEEKRTIAFTLLNQGYKTDAEKIFVHLAAGAAVDSDDVKTVLYLWGPQLNTQQVKWIVSRAATAQGKQQASWLNLLANYASDNEILAFMKRHPAAMGHEKMSARYIQATIHQGSFAKAASAEIKAAAAAENSRLLRQYGGFARQNGFNAIAREVYQQIIAFDAADSDALRELGMLAFEEGRYADSESHLRHYFDLPEKKEKKDAERFRANFYYGEILRYYDKEKMAKDYYANALRLIEENALDAADAMTLAAISQIRMGKVEQGIATFEEAVKRYPENDMLRADYASTLMDVERYKEAEIVLAKPVRASSENAPIEIATRTKNNQVKGQRLLDKGNKLLVEYSGKLDERDLAPLREINKTPWVSYVSEGYGEVIVVAKPGYHMTLDVEKQSLIVEAAMDEESHAFTMTNAVPLRYELLAARKHLDTGDVHDADGRMQKLLVEHPEDIQILSLSASAANSAGNWPRAQKLVAEARKIAPEHEGMKKLARELHKQNAPHVAFDHEQLSNGDNSQDITTASGLMKYADNLYLGGMVKNNALTVEALRRADGRIGNFSEDKQQMEWFGQRFTDDNERIKASLFTNGDMVGLGGAYGFLNPYGDTTVSAEWQKPYWEGFDAILDEATRNRIAVSHAVKPDKRWYVSTTSALNQYDNSVDNDVLSTASAKLEMIYTLMDTHPYIALGYGFDGEYDLHHTKAFDSAGTYTKLFAQGSREVHFFSVNVAETWNETWSGDIFAGYAYDRFGGKSPSCSGRLTYAINDQIDVQLRALYGLDRSSSSSATTRIGVNLRWRYDNDHN